MPKTIDHEEMRIKIIRQSFQLFKSQGYQALSMRKIALGLKVTTGVLYHYFPDRDSLIKAILENCLKESIVGKDQIKFFKKKNNESKLENLRQALANLEKDEPTALTTVLLLCDYYRSLSNRKAQKAQAKTASQFLDAFRIALHLPESELALASTILTYVVGLLIVRMWTEEDQPILEQADLFIHSILKG